MVQLMPSAPVARANIPFANVWNLQGDLTYERIWQDSYNFDGRAAALHAYYRDATFAAGAFAIYKSIAYDGENEGHQYLIGARPRFSGQPDTLWPDLVWAV